MKSELKIMQSTLSYSYIYLVDNILSLYNVTSLSEIGELDPELQEMTTEICNIFTALPTLMGSPEECLVPFIEQLASFRNILADKYRYLINYQKELDCIVKINFGDESDAQSNEMFHNIDFEQVATECTDYVFLQESTNLINMAAAEILALIPMRMTQSYFFDYVSKSLSYVHLPEDPAQMREVLQGMFDNFILKDDKEFSEIFDAIKSLKNMEAEDDIEETVTFIDTSIEYFQFVCSTLFNISCAYFNLLMLTNITFEDIKNLHVSYNDFYHTLTQILNNEHDESVSEALQEQVQDVLCDKLEECASIADRTNNSEHIRLMMFNLLLDVEDIFMYTSDEQPIDRTPECQVVIDEFLEEAALHLKAMSKEEAKMRMQIFISDIPCIMTDTQFYEYVMSGFGNTTIPNEAALTIATKLIGVLLSNEEEFSEDDYFDDDVDLSEYYDEDI